MAIEVGVLVSHSWFILLFSLILSLLAFPLVVLMSFLYDYLVKHNPKTPKIFLMLVCTFVGMAVVAVLLELYLGYTLPQVFSSSP